MRFKRRHAVAVVGLIEDQAARIERLEATLRLERAAHETTLRELDRARTHIAVLEVVHEVDDTFAELLAGNGSGD